MSDWQTRRDELADKRSQHQCTSGNTLLDKAMQWYLKVGFEDGYNAGRADAIKEAEVLVQMLQPLLTFSNHALLGECCVYGHNNEECQHQIGANKAFNQMASFIEEAIKLWQERTK